MVDPRQATPAVPARRPSTQRRHTTRRAPVDHPANPIRRASLAVDAVIAESRAQAEAGKVGHLPTQRGFWRTGAAAEPAGRERLSRPSVCRLMCRWRGTVNDVNELGERLRTASAAKPTAA
jgi:hypothetical protein